MYLKKNEGYTVSLKSVCCVLVDGKTNFPLELKEGKYLLPWGKAVETPETPEAPVMDVPQCGILEIGYKNTQNVMVWQEIDGAKIFFGYIFEYTLTAPITERRWGSDWCWVTTEKGITFRSNRWEVELPLKEEDLGTEKEYYFLCANQVYFVDRDGDSCMSSSHRSYWEDRITYLSQLLGLADPFAVNPPQKTKVPLIKIEERNKGKFDFVVEDNSVFVIIAGNKIKTDLPGFVELSKNRVNQRLCKFVEATFLGKKVVAFYRG